MNDAPASDLSTEFNVPGAALSTVAIAALYGAVSAINPLVVIDVLMAVLSVFTGYVLFHLAAQSRLVRLAGALIAGAAAVWAMWMTWIWVVEGGRFALAFAKLSPVTQAQTLYALAENQVMSISRRGTTIEFGATGLRRLWLGASLAVGLAPVFGALSRKRG